MSEEFPFTTPATSDARTFIQWKGTNVCLDFYCPCGVHSHLDEDFAYYVGCPGCGAVYEMGTQVIARRRTDMALDDISVKEGSAREMGEGDMDGDAP